MVGGIGDIISGGASIFGSFMQADAQREAARVAQNNAIMQYMLGNRNINTQERLGNKNLDLQKSFGDRNYNLQRDTAQKTNSLASSEGDRVIQLIKAMTARNIDAKQQGLRTQREGLDTQKQALRGFQDNLDLQRKTAGDTEDLAKASKFDSHGNEVYFDPATKSFKVRLAPKEQQLMEANQEENLKRSTVDQVRARRGNEQNERNRNEAGSLLSKAITDYKYGQAPVNEGELSNQLISADREEQAGKNRAIKEGLNTAALRTGNSGSIRDIGREFRTNNSRQGSSIADAMLKAKQFALSANQQDKQSKGQNVSLLSALSRFTGDAYNDMGNSSAFDTTTRQADAGAGNLARTKAQGASDVGDALLRSAGAENAYGNSQKQYGLAEGAMGDVYAQAGQAEGDAIKSRTGAMINALSNGAAAQGSALSSSASAQGNAYNSLMSALAGAYTNQADNVSSAEAQRAKFLSNQRMDLSGLSDIFKGASSFFTPDPTEFGGTTNINKVDRQRAF